MKTSVVHTTWATWLTDPTSIQTLKAADFWFGAIGFAITLAGFVVAYIKLNRVEKAASAAELALKRFKFRSASYEAANDAAVSIKSVAFLTKHVEAGEWSDISRMLTELRHANVRMQPTVSTADSQTGKALEKLSVGMERTIRKIELASAPSEFPVKADVLKMTRNITDLMHVIQQLTQGKANE
jgi:hypothetical protein